MKKYRKEWLPILLLVVFLTPRVVKDTHMLLIEHLPNVYNGVTIIRANKKVCLIKDFNFHNFATGLFLLHQLVYFGFGLILLICLKKLIENASLKIINERAPPFLLVL